jgi:hypothetical protein
MIEDRILDVEKRDLLLALDRGRGTLGRALAGVGEDLAARRPANGGWSILEIVNHLVESESYLLGRLRVAKHSEHLVAPREREGKIAARAADRTRPIAAPPESQPRGRYATLAEAVGAFDATRAETVQFLDQFDDDLRCWATDHPLFPGPVSCQETVIMMAAHPGRHADQILEIRKATENEDSLQFGSKTRL